MTRSRLAVAIAALGVAALGACGSPSAPSPGSATDGAGQTVASCSKDGLKLVTPGKLTVGTDSPAYEPWFVDNDPSNGKGFESAVAYAIADKLGFPKDEVTWQVVPFNNAIAPAPKNFDFDVNQISISEQRRKAVDFSSGYYDVRQAVVTYKGSPIDGKTAIADLKGAALAAQVGTTSYTAIVDQIEPTQDPKVFDTNDLAVQALKNKQIDGVVVDVPTAFYMVAAQLDDGVIVGQLPMVGQPEQFGAVLDLHSPLTPCVTKAVDALRADGTLEKLQEQWLTNAGAPELK
ncbi:MAG: ABC transporter substrate-binding protein [Intrasporangium sp.]|uniref:ABC transporter substrate-binding protein n=1 Tax=Intrasporangium sp. TaxID=1925024 RepID=UPI0026471CE9|nr:ABC transporter substrate-binding protein [Intrasporangium sp.]MDN5796102.1 ABC transporter substrate-binding protein [Intrasporangium sp.]